jgi:RNA polymerase sigma factor (sigma-70 family)
MSRHGRGSAGLRHELPVPACQTTCRQTRGGELEGLDRALTSAALRPPARVIENPGLADRIERNTHRDELEHGFRYLSVDHRVVIVLHYLLDMTLEQVAETLDIPKGTVNSRLSRALDSMRAALGADFLTDTPTQSYQETVR